MCDAVMCEDIAGYYKPGPSLFYHFAAELFSPSAAELRGTAGPATLLLLTTQGAFILPFAFPPSFTPPLV